MTGTVHEPAKGVKAERMTRDAETTATADKAPVPLWRRFAPLAVLGVAFGAFFLLGLDKYLSFEALREHRMALTAFVTANIVTAAAVYVVIYAVSVAVSVPGASVLTIAGGLMFGVWLGTGLTVVAATIGAIAIFLIARTAFGDALRRKAGGRVEKLLSGFQEDAFSYLLVLRLVPLFPFFAVNVAPAMAGVGLRVFAVTTFLGIIPGTWVYSQVGTGLGSVFDAGGEFSPTGILTPDVIIALLGLAALSLIPVVYKRLKARRP